MLDAPPHYHLYTVALNGVTRVPDPFNSPLTSHTPGPISSNSNHSPFDAPPLVVRLSVIVSLVAAVGKFTPTPVDSDVLTFPIITSTESMTLMIVLPDVGATFSTN